HSTTTFWARRTATESSTFLPLWGLTARPSVLLFRRHKSSSSALYPQRGVSMNQLLVALALFGLSSPSGTAATSPASKDEALKVIRQIQKADFEADQAALQRGYEALTPFAADPQLASRILYWRGFAQWRRAINGFNDNVDPKELEQDL